MTDFWSRKLGGASTYGRGGRREASPFHSHHTSPAPALPEPDQDPSGASLYHAPDGYAPRQAKVLRDSAALCPNCGSGDYMRPGENFKARCYTCGYPLLHQTSGMVAPRMNQAKVRPTRQLAVSMDGNFSPHTIIGKIGAPE